MSDLTCRICNSHHDHQRFTVREMMYGTRDEFQYFLCGSCGCLQISTFPSDISRYYPSDYYSFSKRHPETTTGLLKQWLIRLRMRGMFFEQNTALIRAAIKHLPQPRDARLYVPLIRASNVSDFSATIIDVGCGERPFRLAALKRLGFKNLIGIDPFISKDTTFCGIPVLKRTLFDLNTNVDLIMFHHSLEHMPDQIGTIKKASELVRTGGSCLIRIPLVDSNLWELYGTNWVELDAPRHFFLHSHKSITTLAKLGGFELASVVYDSGAWEFIASEQYARNIPMRDPHSYFTDAASSGIGPADVREFECRADELNRIGRAGRAGFFFRKLSPAAERT